MAPPWKGGLGQPIEGSNPSLSARRKVLVSLDTGIFLLLKKKIRSTGSIFEDARKSLL
jgi:hypothetical protein